MDVLGEVIKAAGFYKELLGKSYTLAVTDLSNFIWYAEGDIKLGIKVGDAIKPGSNAAKALETRKRQVRYVEKELHGIPFMGVTIPIFDGKGGIAGTLGYSMETALADQIRQIGKNIYEEVYMVGTRASSLSSIAEEMAATSSELSSSTDDVRSAVDCASEVVAIITGIAKRIHLIGLNASIEAARVGQYGMGFGVVAEEIRKMAEKTRHNVVDASGNLDVISDKVSAFLDKSRQISEVAEEQAATIEEITAILYELEKQTKELSVLSEKLIN